MKMNEITKLPSYQDIAAALQLGRDYIKKGAEMLVQVCDANPNALVECHRATGIPIKDLNIIELIGRNRMHVELMFDNSPASRYIALLPPSQQNECYDKTISVAVKREGKIFIEERKAQTLSRSEALMVFDPAAHRVRPVEEQMKVVTDTSLKPTRAKTAQRYIITGDTITILAKTTFTAVQLEDVLAKLKANALQSLAKKK
jgi:hypothetical protein